MITTARPPERSGEPHQPATRAALGQVSHAGEGPRARRNYRAGIGPRERFPVPDLHADDATRARRRAASEAGHRGDAATARPFLADSDPRVRSAAVGALARIGALEPAELAAALHDPAPVVRRRALHAAAATAAGPPPEWSLLALLDDGDPSVVETAAWACGECQPPEAGTVERLAELATTHDNALVREAAVAALGAIGDEAGLPAILVACRDKPAVRRRAVLALAPFDGPEVRAALRAARDDRDWQVRQAAEDLE
ncbi:MAG TPA: HEAT repeat domain-containing protein [Acidimicrobiales bacterium]|nr:HEAT repeat domain-containing protein [Acidimicrobiales bacterium]